MNKKRVYIETSIVSYLTARPSSDLLAAAWQKVTVDWWDTQRDRFDLFVSDIVMAILRFAHLKNLWGYIYGNG